MDTSSLIPTLAVGTFAVILIWAGISYFRNRAKRQKLN